MLPLIAAGIAAGGSALVNGVTSIINTNKQNKANRELAEYSYSKDLEMWNRANEYNLPSSQMARLKAAGLNPNLVYSSGGATTQAAQMPKYNAPTMSYNYKPVIDPLTMLGAYQDFRLQNAQIDNVKAQTENTQMEAANKAIIQEYLGPTWLQKLNRLKQDVSGNVFSFDIANQKLANLRNTGKILEETAKYSGDFHRERVNQQRAAIQQMMAGTKLKGMEADMFDWTRWSSLLQGFGIKLPSFRRR